MPPSLPAYEIAIADPSSPTGSDSAQEDIPQLVLPPTFPLTPEPPIASPSPDQQASPSALPEPAPAPPATPEANDDTNPSPGPPENPPAPPDVSSTVQEQIDDIPNPVVKNIARGAFSVIRPPLLLFSKLLPGQYYQSFNLPLPYTLILMGIAAGLVSVGLLLIRL